MQVNTDIAPRKKNGLLPEKVMPFTDTIKVLPGVSESLAYAAGDTEILIVVNGVVELAYRGPSNTDPKYRRWNTQMVNTPGSTYLCPVTSTDTISWRGLVQAFVKQIGQGVNGEAIESPYYIVPLFIAKQKPDPLADVPSSGSPNTLPGNSANIQLQASANCVGNFLNLTIQAQMLDTSGTVVLEINVGSEWNAVQIFTGPASRSLNWSPEMQEGNAPFGTFQLRIRDVSSNVCSNTVTLDIPQCSFDRYEFVDSPSIYCANGLLHMNVSVKYFMVENASVQLECFKDSTWVPLPALTSSLLNDSGEIHATGINLSMLNIIEPASYILRIRNTTTQRYAETMVYLTPCNE